VQAAEAAIAHDEDMIAGTGVVGQRPDQAIDRVRKAHAVAKRCHGRGQIPTQIGGLKNQERSARASAGASWSRCTPSFIVFERGSTTATIRAAPTAPAVPRAWFRSRSDDAQSRHTP